MINSHGRLVVGGGDGEIVVAAPVAGKWTETQRVGTRWKTSISAMHGMDDPNIVLSGNEIGTVLLWDLREKEHVCTLRV